MKPEDLIHIVKGLGYNVILNPKTCFVPWGISENDLPNEMIELRDFHGFMIQTEIQ